MQTEQSTCETDVCESCTDGGEISVRTRTGPMSGATLAGSLLDLGDAVLDYTVFFNGEHGVKEVTGVRVDPLDGGRIVITARPQEAASKFSERG